MIKSLLNAEDELPLKEKKIKEEVIQNEIVEEILDVKPLNDEILNVEEPLAATQLIEPKPLNAEYKDVFKIPDDAGFFKKDVENVTISSSAVPIIEEISEPETIIDPISGEINEEVIVDQNPIPESPIENVVEPESVENQTDLVKVEPKFKPPSKAETIRQSGLAWSAGIIFFGSIVFMLILGWFADLLMGSSPWGIVGGIVLGSIIGFVQFFRITSQIFKNNQP